VGGPADYIDFRNPESVRSALGYRLVQLYADWADEAPAILVLKTDMKPPWARAVYDVFGYGDDDIAAMQQRVYTQYVKTYQRTIRNSISQLGCKPGKIALADGGELLWLQEQATKWAGGIANTYNDWLIGTIGRVVEKYREDHGSLRGMQRRTLAKLIRTPVYNYWHGKRVAGPRWQMGKLQEIAITEQTRAYARAMTAFLGRSKGQFEARVMPGMAVCEECRELVGRGWMPAVDLEGIIFPIHPRCPHGLEFRPLEGSKINCDGLWRGGALSEVA
jgi:hypothetical protein